MRSGRQADQSSNRRPQPFGAASAGLRLGPAFAPPPDLQGRGLGASRVPPGPSPQPGLMTPLSMGSALGEMAPGLRVGSGFEPPPDLRAASASRGFEGIPLRGDGFRPSPDHRGNGFAGLPSGLRGLSLWGTGFEASPRTIAATGFRGLAFEGEPAFDVSRGFPIKATGFGGRGRGSGGLPPPFEGIGALAMRSTAKPQIGMCSGSDKAKLGWGSLIDQNPIRFDMAITMFRPIAG